MRMAASVGASFSWASSSSSPRCYRKDFRRSLGWIPILSQRFVHQQLPYCQCKPHLFLYDKYNGKHWLFRRQICFASNPEDIHSSAELDVDQLNVEENIETKTMLFAHQKRHEGKPGFISFHGFSYGSKEEATVSSPGKENLPFFWFVGPAVLVASLVLPSLYLRRIISTVFEDSLLTDFLILFFTEALFYAGVAVFILLIEYMQRKRPLSIAKGKSQLTTRNGLRVSSVVTLVLSLTIPLITMGFVWPWTGPAASATLAPYLVGLVVQFAFEQFSKHRRSPAFLVVPVIFQVYRLHQLNRAAQLVTALSYSVRGAEATPQTLAINNSLGTLLNVLQFLGVICIWSLATFLMRVFPSWIPPSDQ
ncbi:uncharacterized protein LOC116263724 isoform X2 [Nymphaea colorata]|uniref:uncharacterized protein LOC116263724 isoform X2 n=1 Tax=Nymphaea colorata TaxID=210225 RepID=UPI00129D5C55|nr:uncharacterized protein LOC116263724 isoform X2 [Nymphaea colorata]